MIQFTCNVCAKDNLAADLRRETPTCTGCGSNLRIRSMIRLLSTELFGKAIPLTEFPPLPQIKGLGLSDDWRYAAILANKFSYTNTCYDREPFLDIAKRHPDLYGTYDFIVSSEVFEHIPAPVERALEECHKLLKPNGFLCATVPFDSEGETREHYPDLYEYATVNLGGRPVLVNRRKDGSIEVHEALIFHRGAGATLEMREFSQAGLVGKLLGAGFISVIFDSEYPEGAFSMPLIARKARFVLREGDQPMADDLVRQLQIVELRSKVADLETKLRGVAESRWIKLGNRIGLGPRLG